MKNRWYIAGVAIFASLTLLTFQHCAKFSSQGEDLLSTAGQFQALPGEFHSMANTLGPAEQPINNLQYFGYPFIRIEPELFPEMESHSNAYSVIYRPAVVSEEAGMRDLVARANPNMKVIIFIDDVFHDPANNEMYSANIIASHLEKLRSLVGSNIRNVLYFGFDENALRYLTQHCRRTAPASLAACIDNGLRVGTPANVINEARQFLENAAVTIRNMFPGAGLALIESGPMIRTINPFPENFDLYGYDCYTAMNDCWGLDHETIFRTMRNTIAEMNQRLGGFRRLALIPEATLSYSLNTATPQVVSTGKTEADAIRVFDQHFELIKNEPMVILIGTWIWQSFPESNVMWGGVRGNPALREHVEAKGRSISRKPAVAWNKPPVIEFVASPGKVGEKSTWFWSTTGATMCYSVTEPNQFQNLPPNGYLQSGVETVARNIEYTIGCRGPYGESQKTVRYTVVNGSGGPSAPALTYSPTNFSLEKNRAVNIVPGNAGGAIVSCSVSPNLPAGLSLSASTCLITGTPSVPQSSTQYRITATNTAGYNEVNIQITISDVVLTLPAPNISYPQSTYSLTQNLSVNILANNSGGPITSCSSAPALPSGLSLSSTTCQITGAATNSSSSGAYTITASNAQGSSPAAVINISVAPGSTNVTAPNISFSQASYVLNPGSAMTPISPTNTGGPIVDCSISPNLPLGMMMSTTTCLISGTPISAQAAVNYTIQANNSGGASTKTISIMIQSVVQPPVISYASLNYDLPINTAMSSANIVNTGGPISSCSIQPTLPAGLSFSTTNCTISGTPTVQSESRSYTIRATNSGGTGQVQISLAVRILAPSITFAEANYEFIKDENIATTTPNNSGGTITSCTSNPALPAGLTLSNTTCAISGKPTSQITQQNFTIRATNSTGSSEHRINITVKTLAIMSCAVTKDILSSYSMSGVIKPDSTHAGSNGFFFVAGYDVVEGVWYSFDGASWYKHTANVDSSFAAIGSGTVLAPNGVEGNIFVDENLSPFPNGLIWLGYGKGNTKIEAWDEMMTSQRHFNCDTLPSN